MADPFQKRILDYPMVALFLASFATDVFLFLDQWIFGVIGLFVLFVILLLMLRSRRKFYRHLVQYLSTLSHRVHKVGNEALLEMPIGILLYNEQYQMEWGNHYIHTLLDGVSTFGHSLNLVSERLIPCIHGEMEHEVITVNKRKFRVYFRRKDRLLYFFDVTEQLKTEQLYHEEKTVFGIIYIDNYDELTQGMEDQARSQINSKVTSILNHWSTAHGVYIKRTSSERFFAVFNQHILRELAKAKFDVLDEVRESTAKESVPLTLSIGIGSGHALLPELGGLAQSSLDLALGRGGDQVVVKQVDGRVTFYGGKTNPIEKRTRVRARVISHALSELILESDQVIIMGHVHPDMDAIGAAIGILKVAKANGKEGFIVLDKQKIGPEADRIVEKIKGDEALWSCFISPGEAVEAATGQTLLVVVDTHRPSLVIENRLIQKMERIVIIDHHRRGEEFIPDPVLVYMEPYASSTAELVTELLEYQPSRLKLSVLEASALLTGITVDTKNFTLRTGSRTFDAASYLRAHGADTILVQRLLRDDLKQYIEQAKLVERTEIYRDGFAISEGDKKLGYDQMLLAKTADTLLSMDGVTASFVVAKHKDGMTGISARSLGDINVQMIMESLGGGGHLTNAAAQFENVDLDEAVERLKQIIDRTLEGREEQ